MHWYRLLHYLISDTSLALTNNDKNYKDIDLSADDRPLKRLRRSEDILSTRKRVKISHPQEPCPPVVESRGITPELLNRVKTSRATLLSAYQIP